MAEIFCVNVDFKSTKTKLLLRETSVEAKLKIMKTVLNKASEHTVGTTGRKYGITSLMQLLMKGMTQAIIAEND